jgi:hypothetical protein
MQVETIAKILNIESENGKYPFKVVDSKEDHGLYMIHYDADEIGKTTKDSIDRSYRGVIVSDVDGIIVPSFGYTPSIVMDDFDVKVEDELTDKDGNKHKLGDFGITRMFPMFDGTLLRVWKYKDQIHISSHKKIDAINSRWGTSGKFVELFTKYTKDIFGEHQENLFDENNKEKIQIHNFLLVDIDLMISSKLHLDTSIKTGFVLHINSINCELIEEVNLKIPNLHYSEIGSNKNTLIKVMPFDVTTDEYKSFLTKGFYTDMEKIHSHISMGEGIVLFNGKSMLKVVSNGYNRRSKIVNNDPNILHRVYELITDTKFSPEGDTYLEQYPVLPCPTDEQIKEMSTIMTSFPENWSIPNEDDFKKQDTKGFDLRFRNAVMHYAVSLPLYHQKVTLTAIKELVNNRYKAINEITNNYERFAKKQFPEGTNARDLKVYERIHKIVMDSKSYANVRMNRGEKLDGATKGQTFNKFVKDNIRNLIFREYGTSLYKIVRVLVHDATE